MLNTEFHRSRLSTTNANEYSAATLRGSVWVNVSALTPAPEDCNAKGHCSTMPHTELHRRRLSTTNANEYSAATLRGSVWVNVSALTPAPEDCNAKGHCSTMHHTEFHRRRLKHGHHRRRLKHGHHRRRLKHGQRQRIQRCHVARQRKDESLKVIAPQSPQLLRRTHIHTEGRQLLRRTHIHTEGRAPLVPIHDSHNPGSSPRLSPPSTLR
jgi:hypothetical protein